MPFPKHCIRDGSAAKTSIYYPDADRFYFVYFDPGRTHFFGPLPYHSTSKCGTKELQGRCSSKCIFCGGTSPGCKPIKKEHMMWKHELSRLEIESRLQKWNANGMVAAKLHYIFTFFYYLQFFLLNNVLPKVVIADYSPIQFCKKPLTYWLYHKSHIWLRCDVTDKIKISRYSNQKIYADDIVTFPRESKTPYFSSKEKNRFLCISGISQKLIRKLVSSRTSSNHKITLFAKSVILHRFFELNSVSRSIQAAGLTWEQMELYETFHFWTPMFVNKTRLKNNL